MFKSRFDAASRLAVKLKKYKDSDAVVLAIPRGGLEIGYVLAQQLNLPLEVILIKKIGHPANKELAIGAVSLYGRVINDDANASQAYIENECNRIREQLEQDLKQYKESINLENRTVILTDDGIATGHTILTAIEVVKENNPAKIVVAVPVAPKLIYDRLVLTIDEVICEETPHNFNAVGEFYENFNPTHDTDALTLFKKANKDHIET